MLPRTIHAVRRFRAPATLPLFLLDPRGLQTSPAGRSSPYTRDTPLSRFQANPGARRVAAHRQTQVNLLRRHGACKRRQTSKVNKLIGVVPVISAQPLGVLEREEKCCLPVLVTPRARLHQFPSLRLFVHRKQVKTSPYKPWKVEGSAHVRWFTGPPLRPATRCQLAKAPIALPRPPLRSPPRPGSIK